MEVVMERHPRGYVGRDHTTIGSDILAVLHSVQRLTGEGSGRLAEQILGGETVARISALDPRGWYPIAWELELMETLDSKLGRYGLIKMGRTLFKLSHEAHVKANLRSGRDIIYGFDEMYHNANRGTHIGGWAVRAFSSTTAELEKTTPHHCAMEEGILAQALQAVGVPAVVEQRHCFREGADSCLFAVMPQVTDSRWLGLKG
jgi:hypothetical protein